MAIRIDMADRIKNTDVGKKRAITASQELAAAANIIRLYTDDFALVKDLTTVSDNLRELALRRT